LCRHDENAGADDDVDRAGRQAPRSDRAYQACVTPIFFQAPKVACDLFPVPELLPSAAADSSAFLVPERGAR
jgi:hypothetical protein